MLSIMTYSGSVFLNKNLNNQLRCWRILWNCIQGKFCKKCIKFTLPKLEILERWSLKSRNKGNIKSINMLELPFSRISTTCIWLDCTGYTRRQCEKVVNPAVGGKLLLLNTNQLSKDYNSHFWKFCSGWPCTIMLQLLKLRTSVKLWEKDSSLKFNSKLVKTDNLTNRNKDFIMPSKGKCKRS